MISNCCSISDDGTARIDRDAHLPGAIGFLELGFDLRFVVAERAQCRPRLAGCALRQAADHLGVEFLGGRQAVEARQRLHVFEERALDTGELDLKLRVLVSPLPKSSTAPAVGNQARVARQRATMASRKRMQIQTGRRRRRCSSQATIAATATTAMSGSRKARLASRTEPPSSAVEYRGLPKPPEARPVFARPTAFKA